MIRDCLSLLVLPCLFYFNMFLRDYYVCLGNFWGEILVTYESDSIIMVGCKFILRLDML